MANKRKDRGTTRTLTDMIRMEERAKHQCPTRNVPANIFPFSPPRENRRNVMGFNLDKWDCRILRGVQEHGFKPIREFCKAAKVPERIFYERFRVNPHLSDAMKLLAFSNLAVAFPKAMSVLTEKFSQNAKWAELYLKVVGLLGDSGDSRLKLIRDEGTPALMTEDEVERYLEVLTR